ncbi:MAG TPA: transglycosylase domain-containing protein [Streptosporangiaceae bacterium]
MPRVLARMGELAVAAGLLAAGLALPPALLAGSAVRDAAQTFDSLSVPRLTAIPSRSAILASDGSVIAYYYPDHIYRDPVSYSQIAPSMRQAIVAIEDSRYYHHGAIDLQGTMRAVATDLTGGQIQGGSTIAQQYVKNALLLTAADTAEQRAAAADTVARKIRELRIAANIEHQLSPDQLLAAYLNAAYFDNETYGVEVAAQRYFGTTAAGLTLDQSALLAGLVENPSLYDPVTNPTAAVQRRNLVLARMAQLHYISKRAATTAERAPLGLHYSVQSLRDGCAGAAPATAWFCDYVVAEMRTNPAFRQAWHELNTTGGLTIDTTMSSRDQAAAQNAVSFMLPSPPSGYNPGRNAAAEVLIEPGTGRVQAIAVDRVYGTQPGQDSINYAVDSAAGGSAGVQTGSSSKLFTLITALEQNYPFGWKLAVKSPSTVGSYFDCRGQPTGPFQVSNAEGAGKGTYTLYTGTTQSINVFFAELEQKVGLCNVVRTAVSMGVHRADGGSLLSSAGKQGTPSYQPPADDLPSFTLGSVNTSPMTMAAAYATVAAGGVYCQPVVIDRISAPGVRRMPIPQAGCHRVMSADVAAAATYILQGVLTNGTAKGDGITRAGVSVPQAGKTGTANSFDFAAFGGYTPKLAGYVSMFNPVGPVTHPMVGYASCYRSAGGGKDCPGSVFGANAGQIWQLTFSSADLGTPIGQFTAVPASSGYFRQGRGPLPDTQPAVAVATPAGPRPRHGGHHR